MLGKKTYQLLRVHDRHCAAASRVGLIDKDSVLAEDSPHRVRALEHDARPPNVEGNPEPPRARLPINRSVAKVHPEQIGVAPARQLPTVVLRVATACACQVGARSPRCALPSSPIPNCASRHIGRPRNLAIIPSARNMAHRLGVLGIRTHYSVRRVGFEPTRPLGQCVLSASSLPFLHRRIQPTLVRASVGERTQPSRRRAAGRGLRDQLPNQRALRLEPKCCFSATRAPDGSWNVPVGSGPEKKSTSTRPTRPAPNSM
jgi:hypothetical protein